MGIYDGFKYQNKNKACRDSFKNLLGEALKDKFKNGNELQKN